MSSSLIDVTTEWGARFRAVEERLRELLNIAGGFAQRITVLGDR